MSTSTGHGPYFAVTSETRQHGTWEIVGDGADAASALAAGIASVAGDAGTTQLEQLTANQAGIKMKLVHMKVLTRPQTVALVGQAKMLAYEPGGAVRV